MIAVFAILSATEAAAGWRGQSWIEFWLKVAPKLAAVAILAGLLASAIPAEGAIAILVWAVALLVYLGLALVLSAPGFALGAGASFAAGRRT
jgi:hypothetical protein